MASGPLEGGERGRQGPVPLSAGRTSPQFLLARAGALRGGGRGPQSYVVRRPGAQKTGFGRAPARRRGRGRGGGRRRQEGGRGRARAPQRAAQHKRARATGGGGEARRGGGRTAGGTAPAAGEEREEKRERGSGDEVAGGRERVRLGGSGGGGDGCGSCRVGSVDHRGRRWWVGGCVWSDVVVGCEMGDDVVSVSALERQGECL